MKEIKNIVVAFFLIFIVSMYWERCIIDKYTSKVSIENTSSAKDSLCLTFDSSCEEDEIPADLPKNAVQIINSYSERFASPVIVFPTQLYYSIWQPPKIS
jgi:hypothetical protein